MRNKYNLEDRVLTKIHYLNDPRREVEATIIGMNLEPSGTVKYKIHFGPDKYSKDMGCTGCEGYVDEDDIIGLCMDDTPIWNEIRHNYFKEDEKCIFIDAWLTNDDNEEGTVIAKVYPKSKRVEYLDERAKINTKAQETIKFVLELIDEGHYN